MCIDVSFRHEISIIIILLLFIGQTIILYKLYLKTESNQKKRPNMNAIRMVLSLLILTCGLILAEIGYLRYFYPTLFNMKPDNMSLGMIITTIIFYPIAEELINRGMILNNLTKKYKFWIANVIQAIFFCIAHFNIQLALIYLAVGLILGIIKKNTSIYWTIAIHCSYNLGIYLFSTQRLKVPNVHRSYYLIMGLIFSFVVCCNTFKFSKLANVKSSSVK